MKKELTNKQLIKEVKVIFSEFRKHKKEMPLTNDGKLDMKMFYKTPAVIELHNKLNKLKVNKWWLDYNGFMSKTMFLKIK